MLVVGGLRHQHAMVRVARLDEVMRSNIAHDLGTGQDLDVELILDLVELLGELLAMMWRRWRLSNLLCPSESSP